jgi:hypothetical protein
MKTNKKYALLSLVTAVAAVGMSLSALSFAQTVTPVSCSAAISTVAPNQAAIFTATCGNGSYVWSGTNLNVTNATGNQFAVSYPNPGVYTILVSSAGFSGSCTMTVAGTVPTGALLCSPAVQNVNLGSTATFAATGGNGTYTWSSPDLTITNASGSGFSASYASTGLKLMTVSSQGVLATCSVNVLSNAGVTVTPPVVTPTLPATGGGYNQQ